MLRDDVDSIIYEDDNVEIKKAFIGIPGIPGALAEKFYGCDISKMIESFKESIPNDEYENSKIRTCLEQEQERKSVSKD